MRGRRGLLNYRDAVALLGGDNPALTAADRVLGNTLSLATGGASDTVLSVFDGRLLRLGHDLTSGLRERLGRTERADRTERLAAANAVLAVTAYFEALDELQMPISLRALDLTYAEQMRLSGAVDSDSAQSFAESLVSIAVPQPTPQVPYENVLTELLAWYQDRSRQLTAFITGLALWDDLTEALRSETRTALGLTLPPMAVDRYQELYAQLAEDIPEFALWVNQVEHQATRSGTRQALAGVETALAGLTTAPPMVDVAGALAARYRAALARPIFAEGETPDGFELPTLSEGYVDPDFRMRTIQDSRAAPADEEWWNPVPVRSDLTEFLAGVLTSVTAHNAPLLVLGQPGAGKSVLTRTLAARLPSAGFLPVWIKLRDVSADVEIQDQIEQAVRMATGEQVSWPDLIRAASGHVPVLLFDGFDELLQATGVSQSDYLTRIADFIQRETDQGRPALALVTSRIAVADKARCPKGTVVLRLEPFRRVHIESWLAVWARLNAGRLERQGLRPLPAEVALRHPTLAAQPLLLLMLALYDAASNALQRSHAYGPLGEAELYEELLVSFARREVGRETRAITEEALEHRVDQELQRLSLIAFGTLNRNRQWVTAAEVEEDLTGLLGRTERPVSVDFRRTPLDRAEIALSRFFFVKHGEALSNGQSLATYEFLHATFGEYLAARMVVDLAAEILNQRQIMTLGTIAYDDDLLYALLSYTPLSSRQILRFVAACIAALPEAERRRLGELLTVIMIAHRERVEHKFSQYRPVGLSTANRHAIYNANLTLLTVVAFGGRMTVGEIYTCDDDPPVTWHRSVLFWRSTLSEPEWAEFAQSIQVRQIWVNGRRDLEISLEDSGRHPEPVDLYWHFELPPGHAVRSRRHSWSRSYWDQIWHRMEISGGTNESVVRHAMDPVFSALGPVVTTFVGRPGVEATSLAHLLIKLVLAPPPGCASPTGDEDDLIDHYRKITSGLQLLDASGFVDDPYWHHVTLLILRQLVADAPHLPKQLTGHVLRILHQTPHTPERHEWTARAALAALTQPNTIADRQEDLQRLWAIYGAAMSKLHSRSLQRFAKLWEESMAVLSVRELFRPLQSGLPLSSDELLNLPSGVVARAFELLVQRGTTDH
ncbi:NACHT domain-containing protein [Streptomyces microflavus]|uniref:NACHT domain-containing protein n=1 Tax=Streptomyces microflavus TaxID=1919 RepID=UPI0038058059